MNAEAVTGVISICATVTLAIAGGTVWICAKLEKISLAIAQMVPRKECLAYRKRCSRRKRHEQYRD